MEPEPERHGQDGKSAGEQTGPRFRATGLDIALLVAKLLPEVLSGDLAAAVVMQRLYQNRVRSHKVVPR